MSNYRLVNKIPTDVELKQVKFIFNHELNKNAVIALTVTSNVIIYNIDDHFEGDLILNLTNIAGNKNISCMDFNDTWSHF